MSDLCTLGSKYGTDKYPCYTPYYDQLFHHRRELVTDVLEIGIGTPETMAHVINYHPGASLRMWEEYFPNAQILGLDIDPRVLINQGRITSRLVDQNDLSALHEACAGRKFDLILDDASHDPGDQLHTLLALWNYLKPDGDYIIEDVNELPALAAVIPMPHEIKRCTLSNLREVGRLIHIKR